MSKHNRERRKKAPSTPLRPSLTPPEITTIVSTFAGRLVAGAVPVYVPVRTPRWAKKDYCIDNVTVKIELDGGAPIGGWLIHLAPDVIMSEAHVIWQSPEDELVDVSPHNDSRILFLPDPSVRLSPEVLPPHGTYQALGQNSEWRARKMMEMEADNRAVYNHPLAVKQRKYVRAEIRLGAGLPV